MPACLKGGLTSPNSAPTSKILRNTAGSAKGVCRPDVVQVCQLSASTSESAEPLLISPWSIQMHLRPPCETDQLTVVSRSLPSSPPPQKARQWWAGLRSLLVKDTWGGGVWLDGSHSRAQRGILGIVLQPNVLTTSCKRRSIEGKRPVQGNTVTWQEPAWRLQHRLRLTDRQRPGKGQITESECHAPGVGSKCHKV